MKLLLTYILQNMLFHRNIVNRRKQCVEHKINKNEPNINILSSSIKEIRLHKNNLRHIGVPQIIITKEPHQNPQTELKPETQFEEFGQSLISGIYYYKLV